jgi:hypothetical protein
MQNDEQIATDQQKNRIRTLLRELGRSAFGEDALQHLGRRQASLIIHQLQDVHAGFAGSQELDMSRLTELDAGATADGRSAWLIGSALWRW